MKPLNFKEFSVAFRFTIGIFLFAFFFQSGIYQTKAQAVSASEQARKPIPLDFIPVSKEFTEWYRYLIQEFVGDAAGDFLGGSVSNAGDVNGDGYDDVIVGAPLVGKAYIFFANPLDNIPDVTLVGKTPFDYFGDSVSSAGDVNGDTYDDVIVGEPYNDEAGRDAGKVYIYLGSPSMEPEPQPYLELLGAGLNDYFGTSVSDAGNVNEDTYDDVIIGASGSAFQHNTSGQAYIFYGGELMDAVADVSMVGEAVDDEFGVSVSDAGDVNGDTYDDVIVGARYNDEGGTDAGKAYIYLGSASITPAPEPYLELLGESEYDNFGNCVNTAGDVNKDGYADVIVGAPLNDEVGIDAGQAYIFYGGNPVNKIVDVNLSGEAPNDWFGMSVSGAGDFNGDGYDDVIVGARYNDEKEINAGKAYIFYGDKRVNNVEDMTLKGEAQYDNFSYSVSTVGDVNGDGFGDVIIGAPYNAQGGENAGKAYIFAGH